MNRKYKSICVVAIIIVSVLLTVWVYDRGPDVEVTYEIENVNELNVTVEGEEERFVILLYDQEDEKMEQEITPYEMRDGYNTKFDLGREENEFQLLVEHMSSSDIVYESTIDFPQPEIDVVMSDIEVETVYPDHHAYPSVYVYSNLTNIGELPFRPGYNLTVGNASHDGSAIFMCENGQYIKLNETREVRMATDTGPEFSEGETYDLTLELYSRTDDLLLDTYETEVTMDF